MQYIHKYIFNIYICVCVFIYNFGYSQFLIWEVIPTYKKFEF